MGGYTKGPWVVSEYSDTGGYDCMTGGIQAGPVTLDGADYGQEWCAAENETCPPQMMADARLIAAAPELLEALEGLLHHEIGHVGPYAGQRVIAARAAIAKATKGI
jgi:hypothetical protein